MYKKFQLFNCEPSQKSRTRLQLILNAHFKFVRFKKKKYASMKQKSKMAVLKECVTALAKKATGKWVLDQSK